MQTLQRDDDQTDAARRLEEAGRALEAFARTGALARTEIERLARTGEADLERLARRLAVVIAELTAAMATGGMRGGQGAAAINVVMNMGEGTGGGGASLNRTAALIAEMVRRGARFQ